MATEQFRADVQDNLIRLLFDKHRLNILKVPRDGVRPGQAFLVDAGSARDGTAQSTLAVGPVGLGQLIDGLQLPPVDCDVSVADVSETYSTLRSAEAQAGIFGSFLARFWPGASLPDLSAKVAAHGASKVGIRFAHAVRDSMDFAALARALRGRKADLGGFSSEGAVKIFAITDAYRCAEMEMLWTDERGNVLNADAALAEAAKLGAGHEAARGSEGTVTVRLERPLTFGVRVMELEPDPGTAELRLRLRYTMLDVLGGHDHRRAIWAREGETAADERDYSLVASDGPDGPMIDLL